MKKNVWKQMIGLTAAAVVSMAAMGVAAEETETAETVTETEAETEAPVEPVPVDVVNEDGSAAFTLMNSTGVEVTEAVLSGAASSEEADTESETEVSSEAEAAAAGSTLSITFQDGTKHLFENVPALQDAEMTEELTFFYISYTGEGGEINELAETADEKKLAEPLTMYVLNDVYIRSESTSDSDALGVASLGSEVTVTGGTPTWYKVEQGDITGYVSRSYLSEDQESADAAVAAEEAEVARVQAEAAAAAQAQAEAAAQAQSQAPAQSQEVYEVSRQAFDDCDGSGHGYYEITYSDGSTAIEYY